MKEITKFEKTSLSDFKLHTKGDGCAMGLAAGALAGFTPEELKELAEVDVRTVDINSLTDLRDIEIDTKAPVEKKLASFARQTNNPYVNRIGDYVVKVCYQEEGSTIDEKMEEYIRRLAEIYV